MKKVLVIIMVLSLSFSLLTGCGAKNNTESTDSNTSEGSTVSQEPLAFSVMTVNFGEDPTGKVVNNAWLEEMENLMGRELDISFQYVAMADYQEKIKIMLASGELPDLITSWGLEQTDIFTYGANGTFVELSSNMDKLPNYQKYLDLAENSKVDLYSEDGKLYGFYAVETGWQDYSGGSNEISYAAAFRKDIFDANNIAIPTTVDEVYEAAKKLKEIYPDKYPIMQMEEWQPPINMLIAANHLGGDYTTNSFDGMYYDGSTYQYGPIQDGYKDALIEMNKWYSEGLISPDYFTQTQANGNATMAAGDGMIIPAAWYGYPAQWANTYPDQEWVLKVGVSNSDYGNAWAYKMGNTDDVVVRSNWAVLVNSKSKVVDDLLTFMDYQMSDTVKEILTWGVEGQTYTEVDGVKTLIDSILADPSTEMASFGFGTGTCRSGIFPQIQDKTVQLGTELSEGFVNDDGTVTTSIIPSYIRENFSTEKARPETMIYKGSKSDDESEEYANIMTPINTYAAEQMASFINGTRSFDEWDEYVSEIKAMGDIDRAIEINNSTIIGDK